MKDVIFKMLVTAWLIFPKDTPLVKTNNNSVKSPFLVLDTFSIMVGSFSASHVSFQWSVYVFFLWKPNGVTTFADLFGRSFEMQ